MYRILVVDDEPYIVDSVSDMIEADMQSDVDVCRAYSVFEALEWLTRTKLDIVVTDISMPGMSGITLLEKIRHDWPKCKVILLTAYAQFDYAYEAIKNNAFSYILKTEADNLLLGEIHKAVALIEKEYKDIEILMEAEKKFKQSLFILQKEYITSLCKAAIPDIHSIAEDFKRLDIRLQTNKIFYILVSRIDSLEEKSEVFEKFEKSISFEHIINQTLQRNMLVYPAKMEENKIFWLLQTNDIMSSNSINANQSNVMAFMKGALDTIQKIIKQNLGISTSFAVSSIPVRLTEVQEKCEKLIQIMECAAYNEDGVIVTDTVIINNSKSQEIGEDRGYSILLSDEVLNCLGAYLDSGERYSYFKVLDAATENLKREKNIHNTYAMEAYYSIAVILMSNINKRSLWSSLSFNSGLFKLYRSDLHGTWSKAVQYLYSLSDAVFDLQNSEKRQLSDNLIDRINQYIQDHITEDISLVKLSEVTGYNSSYISRIYKKVTGENLNDFISRNKMSYIKLLFKDKNLNMNDIAIKSGFRSRTYFNHFINKMTGKSPSIFAESMRDD